MPTSGGDSEPGRRACADEQLFWDWVMDPDAELAQQDEDLLLHSPSCLPLLLAAADDPDCPKQRYCCRILEDYAGHIVGWDQAALYPALRQAATSAAAGREPWTRRWGTYVMRLLSYREDPGPVNRAKAEQMAADLLSGPSLHEQIAELGRKDWLTIRVGADGKHWECARPDAHPTVLHIDRRSGNILIARSRP